MCEITVSNLQSSYLNHRMFLLSGSVGSTEHSDGWGFVGDSGKIMKCAYPMFSTTNAGTRFQEDIDANIEKPFIGHIRKASLAVPVTTENAHPFASLDSLGVDVAFIHNGTLKPKNEKDFIMEVAVQDYDNLGNPLYEKDGKTPVTKLVKRSDSLIFFEKFMEIWNQELSPGTSFDENFLKVFEKTMSLFSGKFAMVFRIGPHTYIARGKTADLYISFLKREKNINSETLGWVINTDKTRLDVATNLLSNLEQMDGKAPLHFTFPQLLRENTVYNANGLELKILGEVKETVNYTTTYSTGFTSWSSWEDDDDTATTGKGAEKTAVEKYTEIIYNFAVDYCLSPQDIFYMLHISYENSSLEMTEMQLQHFCEKVIPILKNFVPKKIRKAMKKVSFKYVPLYRYDSTVQYPWILNTPENQRKFLNN